MCLRIMNSCIPLRLRPLPPYPSEPDRAAGRDDVICMCILGCYERAYESHRLQIAGNAGTLLPMVLRPEKKN